MKTMLVITEANRLEDRFYRLGGAAWDTEAECLAELAKIPATSHNCDDMALCYILDICNEDGSIEDDQEISEATAKALLGVSDFQELRDLDRKRVAAEIAAHRTLRSMGQ